MSAAGEVRHPAGLMGYVDRISAAPGEEVALHVSCDAPAWRAELVRLWALEIPSAGTERRSGPVPDVPAVERESIPQRTGVGSFVRVPGRAGDGSERGLTVSVVVMPTRPGDGAQTALSHRTDAPTGGWSLGLDGAGRPRLWAATEAGPVEVIATDPLVDGCWYRLTGTLDPGAGTARLQSRPVGTFAANRVATGRGAAQAADAPLPGTPVGVRGPDGARGGAPILLGAGWLEDEVQPREPWDGRLERPVIVAAPLPCGTVDEIGHVTGHPDLVAAWDFAAGIGSHGLERPGHVEDVGPHARHGRCVNHPTRAVTGHVWTSHEVDFRHAPEQYAAIHCHRTDMTDCRWTPQASFALPEDLPSGAYALQLTALDVDGEPAVGAPGTDGVALGQGMAEQHAASSARVGGAAADARPTRVLEDLVPVIVRPPRDRATADALLVLSTNSYLAYANDHVGVDSPRTQVWNQMVPTLDAFERYRNVHRELGLSLYETHPDGHGVVHSSWRRPILTLRPTVYDGDGPVWQFTADMQLVDWLQRTGRRVDVVSDRDVHDGGVDLLSRYRCVMTGTHPEYPSEEMLDAYEAYVAGEGRLMYMGGNGMYWVTGYDPDDEQVIEIRRWGATQAWCAPPGEYHLSFTGQQGGAWRFRGRAPQKTFGVGFVGAGPPSAGAGYARVIGADSPVAWVLEGVEAVELGLRGTMGGAAGTEIDAVDRTLGTPDAAHVVATSVGHSDDMLEAR
ncbi:MAG: N,N-dimethylformamidase beta subunit family domain-containing protein, partial [Solirubrobacteraceae bacterium]